MDTINKEKIIINELIKIYNEKDFQDDLENQAKSIANKFKSLLNDVGADQGLISRNSVRDIKYFALVYRIKESDSLLEKFYRGNLLQINFKDFKFASGKHVIKERNNVITTFKKCEDIIGIKILTDLNEDCKKVLTILKDNEDYLNEQQIILNKKDLSAQPTIMKNGLEIYKINGKYTGTYSFELQIKSKIVSAWGDMEHAIFYKDYFISPVRESTQATMNHIGKLLYQIDDFLVSVRNANKEFESNVTVSTFLSWFNDNYSNKIKNKLSGVGFKIDSISEALYYIQTNNEIIIRELNFAHFTFKPKSDLLKNYIKIRNSSYDLKLFESIVLSWFWTPAQIKKVKIDLILSKYFEYIYKYLVTQIIKKNPGLDTQVLKRKIQFYYSELLKYQPKSIIFLSAKEFIKHFTFMQFVKGELDLLASPEDGFDLIFNKLDLIFLNKRMGGNIKEQLRDFNFSPDDLSKYREIISEIVSSIKIKDKNQFNKEIEFIKEIITDLN